MCPPRRLHRPLLRRTNARLIPGEISARPSVIQPSASGEGSSSLAEGSAPRQASASKSAAVPGSKAKPKPKSSGSAQPHGADKPLDFGY